MSDAIYTVDSAGWDGSYAGAVRLQARFAGHAEAARDCVGIPVLRCLTAEGWKRARAGDGVALLSDGTVHIRRGRVRRAWQQPA